MRSYPRVVLRIVLPLVILLAVPLGAPAGMSASATGYRVVAATASARLTYAGGKGTNSRASGFADMKASLRSVRGTARHGSLSARGGSVRFAVNVSINERATVGERSEPSSPYIEQTCGNRARRRTSGGLTFKWLDSSRVQVTWAFPHARMANCPGPVSAGGKLQPLMARVFPAARFQARRVTLTLAGVRKFSEGRYKGTYRWRTAVTLARA